MREASWWIAVGLLAITALTFLIAMAAFFKSRPGWTSLRLTLCVSIAGGLAALFDSLASRIAVPGPRLAAGSLLILAAQALFWAAARAHGSDRPSAAFATGPPPSLTCRGPYRWVRHPFYVAYVLAFAAAATFSWRWLHWLIPLWMLMLYSLAAFQEERAILASPLSAAYQDYRSRVGMFLPRWTALSENVGVEQSTRHTVVELESGNHRPPAAAG